MKLLFKFKYHKTILIILAIALSYFIFTNDYISGYLYQIGGFSYFGAFIAGILFAFGFTAPLSAGFFLAYNPSNIFLGAIIGGFGAVISDLLIFIFMRSYLKDELISIEHQKEVYRIRKLISRNFGHKLKTYLVYAFAGILIASPLPDEVAFLILAGVPHIKVRFLAKLVFVLHTLGILLLLSI